MKSKYKSRFRIIIACAIVSIGFASCGWLDALTHSADDYYLWSIFQIGNTSSEDVTMSFYLDGEPMKVYTEVFNQTSIVYVSPENAEKKVSQLNYSHILQLKAGQTALFYKQSLTQKGEEMKASCLERLGYGMDYFNLRLMGKQIIGDSIVLSVEGQNDSVLAIQQRELWETWYDDSNFTYYHFWRIE